MLEKYECLCAILQALWFLVTSKIVLSLESAAAILLMTGLARLARCSETATAAHTVTVTEGCEVR
jgi:hypothetical protein